MKLSDLAPGDVAVFVRADGDGEQFVVISHHVTHEATLIHKVTDNSPYWTDWHGKTVRRLGRGRLIPARIALDGEPDAGLTWTDAKPTVPGWYWWRDSRWTEPIQVIELDGRIGTPGSEIGDLDSLPDGQFAGPIPVPAERGEGRG